MKYFNFKNYNEFCRLLGLKPSKYENLKDFKEFCKHFEIN